MDSNINCSYMHLARQRTPSSDSLQDARQKGFLPFLPRDKCNCIYLGLVLCGAGFLLPYNSFITAVDYYQSKHAGTTIIFDMSLTYILVAFGGVMINNFFVELIPFKIRITFGYILSFAMLLIITLCDVAYDMFTTNISYYLTLVAVAVVSFGCTVQQSSFYGYTSMLPSRYTQAVMTGESAAGLIVSVNRIVTRFLLPDNVTANTIMFFAVSMIIIAICFIVFHLSSSTTLAQYYINMCRVAGLKNSERGIPNINMTAEQLSLMDVTDSGNHDASMYGILALKSPSQSPHNTIDDQAAGNCVAFYNFNYRPENDNNKPPESMFVAEYRPATRWDRVKKALSDRVRISRRIWPYMLSIALAYFVTLALFPGIETEIKSCRMGSWLPVILISTFNLFDFIGKITASIPHSWKKVKLVLITSSRMLIVPVMMLCAMPRSNPILSGEWYSVSLSAVLGMTNGYFGSVPMIKAPTYVPDDQKELTGNIMTLSYSIGLTAGSAMSYVLDYILGPSVDICININQLNPTYNASHYNTTQNVLSTVSIVMTGYSQTGASSALSTLTTLFTAVTTWSIAVSAFINTTVQPTTVELFNSTVWNPSTATMNMTDL